MLLTPEQNVGIAAHAIEFIFDENDDRAWTKPSLFDMGIAAHARGDALNLEE